jgi:protein-tyrosine-phosphatase
VPRKPAVLFVCLGNICRSPFAASLLLDYVEGRKGEAVADPYYGEATGFEVTWADVTIGAEALARRIAEKR